MSAPKSADIVGEFNVRHALREWRNRGVAEEDLIMILRRDLEHCEDNNQPCSAINIQRMLVALDDHAVVVPSRGY